MRTVKTVAPPRTGFFKLWGGILLMTLIAFGSAADTPGRAAGTETGATPVTRLAKPHEEWRKLLPAERYHILFEEGTEPARSSPLDHEKRPGVFLCAACNLPLFESRAKFDSGTGWPSFFAPVDGAVATRSDRSLFMTRTEVHCRRCGGHLGHVFPDGPRPTGQRYCMNGVALKFTPK
jgi:peptide-methionine (R)-S-oxide reductase